MQMERTEKEGMVLFVKMRPLTKHSLQPGQALQHHQLLTSRRRAPTRHCRSNYQKPSDHIEKLNLEAETRWADKLRLDDSLTRSLVSFQANKGRAVYRWFKYKEAFPPDSLNIC